MLKQTDSHIRTGLWRILSPVTLRSALTITASMTFLAAPLTTAWAGAEPTEEEMRRAIRLLESRGALTSVTMHKPISVPSPAAWPENGDEGLAIPEQLIAQEGTIALPEPVSLEGTPQKLRWDETTDGIPPLPPIMDEIASEQDATETMDESEGTTVLSDAEPFDIPTHSNEMMAERNDAGDDITAEMPEMPEMPTLAEKNSTEPEETPEAGSSEPEMAFQEVDVPADDYAEKTTPSSQKNKAENPDYIIAINAPLPPLPSHATFGKTQNPSLAENALPVPPGGEIATTASNELPDEAEFLAPPPPAIEPLPTDDEMMAAVAPDSPEISETPQEDIATVDEVLEDAFEDYAAVEEPAPQTNPTDTTATEAVVADAPAAVEPELFEEFYEEKAEEKATKDVVTLAETENVAADIAATTDVAETPEEQITPEIEQEESPAHENVAELPSDEDMFAESINEDVTPEIAALPETPETSVDVVEAPTEEVAETEVALADAEEVSAEIEETVIESVEAPEASEEMVEEVVAADAPVDDAPPALADSDLPELEEKIVEEKTEDVAEEIVIAATESAPAPKQAAKKEVITIHMDGSEKQSTAPDTAQEITHEYTKKKPAREVIVLDFSTPKPAPEAVVTQPAPEVKATETAPQNNVVEKTVELVENAENGVKPETVESDIPKLPVPASMRHNARQQSSTALMAARERSTRVPTAKPGKLSEKTREFFTNIPANALPTDNRIFGPKESVNMTKSVPSTSAFSDETTPDPTLGVPITVKVKPLKEPDNIQNLRSAYSALQAGQFEAAVLYYRRILADNPNNVQALFGLGTSYHRNNQLEEARDVYLQLLSVDNTHQKAINNFLILAAQEDPDETLVYMLDLHKANPEFVPLLSHIATIYIQKGRKEEAIHYLTKAANIQPDNLVHRYNLARLLDDMGQKQMASKLYSQLLSAASKGMSLPVPAETIRYYLNVVLADTPVKTLPSE